MSLLSFELNGTLSFAERKHFGTYRKYAQNGISLPYIVHPVAVMKDVFDAGISDIDTLKAALCHDILEDCKQSNPTLSLEDEIKTVCGEKTLSIVKELTRDKNQPKPLYIQSFAKKSLEANVIKIFDRLSNTNDFLKSDPKYAVKYFAQAYFLFFINLDNKASELENKFGKKVVDNIKSNIEKTKNLL